MTLSKSVSLIHCVNCGNAVDTPEEHASYPDGQCPECLGPWTGKEPRGVRVFATVPQSAGGHAA